MAQSKQDMGSGNVRSLMLQLMIPAVVAQVVNLLYNIVDRIYIGHIAGIGAAALTGVGLYVLAPALMGIFTADAAVIALGARVLRIEAFAEPMFAASIVAYGVFVGAADTLVPCMMNFFSIWAVRLSLAALLAPSLGLKGVWIAMCVELCFRGMIFLVRLKRERWMRRM